ncbi:AMP deaminase [Starmerella bacillaris]|uniref:AMP deaminase n=1 Tax=Starmerella bacillaris TaxID=1247836 RepID=A0AAV5RLH6_STABA|nr:AMP deaminase [Starmerella bacillaris]
MAPATSGAEFSSSDEEGNSNHHLTYRDTKQLDDLQGKMIAQRTVTDDKTRQRVPSFSSRISDHDAFAHNDNDGLQVAAHYRQAGDYPKRSTLDILNETDAEEIQELQKMYFSVNKAIEVRRRFMELSLQDETKNPKNLPGWKIYPPPPEPEYDAVTKQFNKKSTEKHAPEDIGNKFCLSDIAIPDKNDYEYRLNKDGVFEAFAKDADEPLVKVPSLREYYMAVDELIAISSDGPTKSFAFRRLQYLEARWNLYFLLNQDLELAVSKRIPHRDFYNVRKVDTHVHHSACMTQKHLLRFIKSKMKKSPNEVVIYRDGNFLTLAKVFESLGLTAYDLNIETLDMHAHSDAFHRFDKFNLKYNPIGESRLREIFLKTDNFIQGRYLAEITREVFSDLEQSKYQMAEYRISIYGRHKSEWSKLAAWVVDNKLVSDNVRWLIQVPRLYDIYKKTGIIKTFSEIVDNIFQPLFEVTKNPRSDPKLHVFLQRVVGFDSVDDESKPDRRRVAKYPVPAEWDANLSPPYSYYLYYLYANIASLNQFRKRLGYNTFVLRPHCGEAGDPEHLVPAFITSLGISHGILLRKIPFMQYLYYLEQVGIAMSPISNNALFLSYEKNPIVQYFRRGLNVSLSSDDPLQFSFTREPLIEEYSIAIQIYKLSSADSRELALYSVMQSGFEHEIKKHWGYDMHSKEINIEKTNVPRPRLAFRSETLKHERSLVTKYGGSVEEYAC